MWWTNLLLFSLAIGALVYSSIWIVRSLTKIAIFLKVSEFAIAFILMAFATSLPELFVGIMSAVSGKVTLSLGNLIGANIANITLVIGIPVLLAKGLRVESKVAQKDTFHMFLVMILPLLLMLDQVLSRLDGIILIGVFILYLIKLWRSKEIFEKKADNVKFTQFFNNLVIFFLAFIVLILSSRFVVKFAGNLAADSNLPIILIGLLLVAVGTTLPELTFGIIAVLSKHKDMALGNILGSMVVNVTLILGLVSLISPINVGFTFALTSAFYMIIAAFLFLTFVHSERKVNWQEGIALILLYIFFVIMQFVMRGISA